MKNSTKTILVPAAAFAMGLVLGTSPSCDGSGGAAAELQELVIVDADGRPRVVLGSHGGSEPGIWVLDEEQRLRIGLHCEPEKGERQGTSSISLYSSQGRPLISVETGHDERHGAHSQLAFRFGGESERPYMTLGNAGAFADVGGALRFWGPDAVSPFMSLEAGRVDGGPMLLMRSHNVHERDDPQRVIYLGMQQARDRLTAALYAGGARIELKVDEDGEPVIGLERDGAVRTIGID